MLVLVLNAVTDFLPASASEAADRNRKQEPDGQFFPAPHVDSS